MKFAVIVHIYYVSLWDGLASAIKNITDDFELFITLSESIEDKEGLVAKILADFPTAKIEVVENKGYDILPFLKVLKTLDLDKYSGIVKLHTKRDMPIDDFRLQPEWRGGNWREALLGFISTKEAWQASLAKFSFPEVSVVSDMRVVWRMKGERSKSFRIDLDVENFCREYFGFKINGTKVSFVAGTMFLAKPAVLKALKLLPLDSLDFGGGNSHKHSIAHVLERVLGVLAEKEGEIAAWQNNQTTRSFFRRRELRRVLQNILRFFFQKKTTRSGYNIVKVLKIPVWRSKAKYGTQSEKDAYEARKKSEVQGKPVKRGAISKIRYEFNRFVVLPPKKLAAMFRRKRYQHVLSLGMNCEIAFRQVIAWGAVDSSLFNWGTTESLSNLTHALEHFEDLFNGEIFRGSNGLWKCAHTGISTHGRKYTAEDKEDTLARMKYLKEKFLKQISDEGKTLLVRRLHDGDLESPNFKEDLLKFDSALRKLGARNHEYLLVVEARNIEKVPRIEGFHVRTVKAFNPTNEVTKKRIGDYVGWSTIFSEFVPVAKPKRRGPYKFEVT